MEDNKQRLFLAMGESRLEELLGMTREYSCSRVAESAGLLLKYLSSYRITKPSRIQSVGTEGKGLSYSYLGRENVCN